MAKNNSSTPERKPTIKDRLNSPWIKDLRGGRGVSIDYFRRNAWLLLGIVVVVLSLMGLRYKTKTRMQEIKQLTRELQRAESDKLREKQEYMTLIRQTRMNELVRINNLGLIHQEQPPFEISADDADNTAAHTPAKADNNEVQK